MALQRFVNFTNPLTALQKVRIDYLIMSEPYYFMLPLLIENGLCKDDRDNYSFVTYPRDVISKAAVIVVADMAERLDSIPLDKKKRVKTVIEYMAVALSLKIQHVSLMNAARLMYRKWFTDPSLFGSRERQNKFLQRLIKQLSLPFAMRDPDSVDIFKRDFNPLLNNILGDLMFAIENLGSMFTYETWDTFLSVSLGISEAVLRYKFGSLIAVVDAENLKQRAVSLVYSLFELSELRQDELWDRFKEYTMRWSEYLDYVKVWGRQLSLLFVLLNTRIYKLPMECPFVAGVYTKESPIPDDQVKFLFHKFLSLIDTKKPQLDPLVLREMALIMSRLTYEAQSIAEFEGDILKRYPAKPFLKLFGRFMTEMPHMSTNFDEAMSILVDTLLVIMGDFDIDPKETVDRLIGYITSKATTLHMEVGAAFVNRANILFSRNYSILPFAATHAMTLIAHFNPMGALRLIDDDFWANMTALFISSTELLKSGTPANDIVLSHEKIWKSMELLPVRHQLLALGPMIGVDIMPKFIATFSDSALRELTCKPEGIPYLAAVILLMGVTARFDPGFPDSMLKSQLLKTFCQAVVKVDIRRIDNYELVLAGALQAILNFLTYCPGMMKDEETISALLVFMNELRPLINEYATANKNNGIPEFTRSLYDQVYFRMCTKMPAQDYFTRRRDSSNEINEERLIELHGLKNTTTTHFTIGGVVFVSFIETEQLKDPCLIFIRGPHGKSCFRVDDVKQFDDVPTRLYEYLRKECLVEPAEVEIGDGAKECEDPYIRVKDIVTKDKFAEIDKSMKDAYAKDFSNWLGEKYGYRTPFSEVTPFHRLRAADFLSTLGLLHNGNCDKIAIIKDQDAIRRVIKQFDELESLPILPVSITHLLPSDKTYHDCKIDYVPGETSKRMTPLLRTFLQEIGEPMTLYENNAGLPALRTSVPTIPSCQSFIAFFTPAMAKTEEGAKALYDMGEQASLKIIFNETDFNLRYRERENPRQQVLFVKPNINGLYHVKQVQCPKDFLSPFAAAQLMTARTLGFFIAICFEQSLRTNPQKTMPNLVERRKEIVASVLPAENDVALAGKIAVAVAQE